MNLLFDGFVYVSLAAVFVFAIIEIRARHRDRKARGRFPMTPIPKRSLKAWIRHPVSTRRELAPIVHANMKNDMQRYMIHIARVNEYNEMIMDKINREKGTPDE